MKQVVGIAGHVDHGKTALVRALTGVETDRLPEEQLRGISIALGFAHLSAPDGDIDIIDLPGHEKFVRTMIAGASGLDAVMLVVAANDGIRPQTIEHVDIAGLLGVPRAIIAVSKADLVTVAKAEAVLAEASALVQRAGLAIAGTFITSATTGLGIDALGAALRSAGSSAPGAADDGFPYLPIDRAFSVAGYGTVVTGTLRRGKLAATDAIEIVPTGRAVRIRAIQIHGVRVPEAAPGRRVAVNLRDVAAADLPRGAALASVGALPPSEWLSVHLRLVETAPPMPNGAAMMLLFGTEEVPVRLRLLDAEEALPGVACLAQLRAARPVSVPARERFILRRASPPLTLGGGTVVDPETVRQRRHAAGVLSRLRARVDAQPAEIVRLDVFDAGAQGITLARLCRNAGLAPARTAGLLQDLPVKLGRNGFVVRRDALTRVSVAVIEALAAEADGLALLALAARLPFASREVVEEAVTLLVRSGNLQRSDGGVVLPRFAKARAAQVQASAGILAEALRRAGLTPPEPTSLMPAAVAKRYVDQLVRAGTLIRAPDPAQGREIVFHQEAVAEARRKLAPLLAPPGLLVKEAGAALGISRKFSVPLLEYFDAIRFTRRIADRRVLAQRD